MAQCPGTKGRKPTHRGFICKVLLQRKGTSLISSQMFTIDHMYFCMWLQEQNTVAALHWNQADSFYSAADGHTSSKNLRTDSRWMTRYHSPPGSNHHPTTHILITHDFWVLLHLPWGLLFEISKGRLNLHTNLQIGISWCLLLQVNWLLLCLSHIWDQKVQSEFSCGKKSAIFRDFKLKTVKLI